MGIKDQFQDKAKQLAEQAKAKAAGTEDQVSERPPQHRQGVKDQSHKAREVHGDRFED
ncbi:hypothetical protein ACFCZ1_11945 [Streptomyces sp. NPDC056224]|uniref:hypothetical protein n=1 Tax=Streptomyces sp. NPDC056224 TaxID=3345750 RepID=UPI0035E28B70